MCWGEEKCIEIFGAETWEKEATCKRWILMEDGINVDLQQIIWGYGLD